MQLVILKKQLHVVILPFDWATCYRALMLDGAQIGIAVSTYCLCGQDELKQD